MQVAANDIAVDAQGTIYVTQASNYSKPIEVFCSLASGNAAPLRTIVQPSASTFFDALALDPAGDLYASDSFESIYEYAPGAGVSGTPSSNATPTPTSRALTKLGFLVHEFGVDGSGNVYAGNGFGVNVYGPSANGDAPAPSRQVTSLVANLTRVSSLAADAAGDVFVLYEGDDRANRSNLCRRYASFHNYSCQAVGIYTAGSSGAPAHILTFDSGKQLSGNLDDTLLTAIAADATGTLYVLNAGPTQTAIAIAIAVYPPGSQDGDATPSRVVTANLNSANGPIDRDRRRRIGQHLRHLRGRQCRQLRRDRLRADRNRPGAHARQRLAERPGRFLAVGADGTAYVGQCRRAAS